MCWPRINPRFVSSRGTELTGGECGAPNFTLARPSGTFRVLFIGDSVTYGTTYVDQKKIFTSRLSVLVPKLMHKPVQILNGSCGAWAIGNEVGYLKARGTYNSNLVVFVVNTGDLNQPFDMNVLALIPPTRTGPRFTPISELWFRYLWPRIRGSKLFRDPGSFVPKTVVESPNIEALLSKADIFCKTHGARLAIVYHPFRTSSFLRPPYPQDKLRLAGWCRENKIPFLDLTSAYAPYSTGKVYYGGVHLTPFGNRIAAEAIAKDWSNLSMVAPVAPTTRK